MGFFFRKRNSETKTQEAEQKVIPPDGTKHTAERRFTSGNLGTFITPVVDGIEGTIEPFYLPPKGDRPQPVEVKMWLHSGKYSVHPHHVAMHGKAVMPDQTFTIQTAKGKTYEALGPHDPKLPQAEIRECRCCTIPVIIFINASEEKRLREEMATTGGVFKELWADKLDSV